MKARLIVAVHKPYWMPTEPMYLPVQAGRALHPAIEGFSGDDTGSSISVKNASYCELTALYWAWKNLDADIVGLVHYRRYFAETRWGAKRERLLTEKTLRRLAEQTDVVVPVPRNYFIETNYSQYAHAHHAVDLDETRRILGELYPETVPAFDRVMASTRGHRFNMLIMKRPQLDAYCSWLFRVLETLEQRLDITSYSAYDARVFGFVAERLLDVWLLAYDIGYRELPVVSLEPQHWPRKIFAFLKRKLIHRNRAPRGGESRLGNVL